MKDKTGLLFTLGVIGCAAMLIGIAIYFDEIMPESWQTTFCTFTFVVMASLFGTGGIIGLLDWFMQEKTNRDDWNDERARLSAISSDSLYSRLRDR